MYSIYETMPSYNYDNSVDKYWYFYFCIFPLTLSLSHYMYIVNLHIIYIIILVYNYIPVRMFSGRLRECY